MGALDRIRIVQVDITEEYVDAIVNPANTDLILGAGVAGAIRRKGGPTIVHECYEQSPIELGDAAMTSGGNLPARFVIHAAVMHIGESPTAESIEKSLFNSLQIARRALFETISFPALGTGVGGFPMDEAALIISRGTYMFLKKNDYPEKVRFLLYDELAYRLFKDTFDLEFKRI